LLENKDPIFFNRSIICEEIVNFLSEMKNDSISILKSLPDKVKNYLKDLDTRNNLRDI